MYSIAEARQATHFKCFLSAKKVCEVLPRWCFQGRCSSWEVTTSATSRTVNNRRQIKAHTQKKKCSNVIFKVLYSHEPPEDFEYGLSPVLQMCQIFWKEKKEHNLTRRSKFSHRCSVGSDLTTLKATESPQLCEPSSYAITGVCVCVCVAFKFLAFKCKAINLPDYTITTCRTCSIKILDSEMINWTSEKL